MLHRFLTLSHVPELRTEPSSAEAGVVDVEVLLPVDVLWQIEETIRELKFLKSAGYSTSRLNSKLTKLVKPYVVNERDRIALLRGNSAA